LRKIKIRIKINDFLNSDKSLSSFIQVGAITRSCPSCPTRKRGRWWSIPKASNDAV